MSANLNAAISLEEIAELVLCRRAIMALEAMTKEPGTRFDIDRRSEGSGSIVTVTVGIGLCGRGYTVLDAVLDAYAVWSASRRNFS